METSDLVCEQLRVLLKQIRKVGTAPRTENWVQSARAAVEQCEQKLIQITASEDKTEEVENGIAQAEKIITDCREALSKINISNSDGAAEGKMDKGDKSPMATPFDIVTAAKIIKEYNGKTSARDYIDTVEVYSETLSPDGRTKLTDFIYKFCLKEEAKKAFLKKPESVSEISKVLLNRFKIRETVAGLNQKLSRTQQGNRPVSKFASVIEGITGDIIELQLARRGEAAREIIQAMADESACEAFKSGLNPELQNVVLASGATTFSEVLDKALGAEAAMRDNPQVNYFRQGPRYENYGNNYRGRGSFPRGQSRGAYYGTNNYRGGGNGGRNEFGAAQSQFNPGGAGNFQNPGTYNFANSPRADYRPGGVYPHNGPQFGNPTRQYFPHGYQNQQPDNGSRYNSHANRGRGGARVQMTQEFTPDQWQYNNPQNQDQWQYNNLPNPGQQDYNGINGQQVNITEETFFRQ